MKVLSINGFETFFPNYVRQQILWICLAFPSIYFTCQILGYEDSPTALISSAMVLLSVQPIEGLLLDKARERMVSNIFGALIGYTVSLLIPIPIVRSLIAGVLIIFIAHHLKKLKISTASTIVGLLIVTEAPSFAAHNPLEERVILVILGCVISYVVVHYVAPLNQYKSFLPKAKDLSLKLIFSVKYKVGYIYEENNFDEMRSYIQEMKQGTSNYMYVANNVKYLSVGKDKYFGLMLLSLEKLVIAVDELLELEEEFKEMDDKFRFHYLRELEQLLSYHVLIVAPEKSYNSKLCKIGEDPMATIGDFDRKMVPLLYTLDDYYETLVKLEEAFIETIEDSEYQFTGEKSL